MNFTGAFFQGFAVGIRQWRITAIVYFIQLCLALTVGMQVYEVMKASIGQSLEVNKLLDTYDHTVWMDFLKVHGASITPLLGELRWLLLVWILFSVFIDSGLLYAAATPKQATARSFWQGGAAYFFPFLKISLFFLILFLVWTVVLWVPLALFFQPSLQYFPSEKYTVWLAGVAGCIWLAGIGVLFVWSVLSRIHHLLQGRSVLASIQNGGRIFRKSKVRFLGILTGFAVLQVLLLMLYFKMEPFSSMTSGGILALFGAQQGFSFLRIQLRQMVYGGMAAGVGASGSNK